MHIFSSLSFLCCILYVISFLSWTWRRSYLLCNNDTGQIAPVVSKLSVNSCLYYIDDMMGMFHVNGIVREFLQV